MLTTSTTWLACVTREAMKWIFDAKAGDVSSLYECGNNDHLLVVALTKVHSTGYRDWESVKDMLTQEVMRDKKFEVLSKKLEGVKTLADAEKQGARLDRRWPMPRSRVPA